MSTPNRVAKGVPTGGQFAAVGRAEASVSLVRQALEEHRAAPYPGKGWVEPTHAWEEERYLRKALAEAEKQLDLARRGLPLAADAKTFTAAPDPTDGAFTGRAQPKDRDWDTTDTDYDPPIYVTPKIAARINAGGPKNVDPTWHQHWSREQQWADGETPRFDGDGMPLNPAGRTGLRGLGGCKRLGENKVADPVVTRTDPTTGKTQVLLGWKETEQQWALPGVTVDEGEDPADACTRELFEEVGLDVDMYGGDIIFQGYVDDHRNTDNAWFSTQARHVHLGGRAAMQEPRASDDISAARWVDVDSLRGGDLFASHRHILETAGLVER